MKHQIDYIRAVAKSTNFKAVFEPLISGGLATMGFLAYEGIGGIAVSALTNSAFKLLNGIRNSGYTIEEKERIEEVLDKSFLGIADKIMTGNEIREDLFDNDSNSTAEQLIEEIIHAAKNELNKKKAGLLSNFFCNVVFLKDLHKNDILRFIDDFNLLRYRHLLLIELYNRSSKKNYQLRMSHYRNVQKSIGVGTVTVLQEVLNLYDKEFVNYKDAKHNLLLRHWINVEPVKLEITILGSEFSNLFNLSQIEESEILELSNILK